MGYLSSSFEEVENIDRIDDQFIEKQKQKAADIAEVPIENVELISKTEYEKATCEEEDIVNIHDDDEFPCELMLEDLPCEEDLVSEESFPDEDLFDKSDTFSEEDLLDEEDFPGDDI